MVSAENFMKVLFFTYDVVRSYEHDREHVATWRHVKAFLIPCNLMGDYMSPGPLDVCGGEPIRQRRTVHQVHRHRCNHGLHRNTSPPSGHVATKLAVAPLQRQSSCHQNT